MATKTTKKKCRCGECFLYFSPCCDTSLVNIFEGSLMILQDLKDLQNSYKDLQGSLIFLLRSSRIFHFLAKILKDLSFPVNILKDLVRISKDLDKNFKDPLKIFEHSLRTLKILVKIFENLSFSRQDLQGSFILLPRS